MSTGKKTSKKKLRDGKTIVTIASMAKDSVCCTQTRMENGVVVDNAGDF
jgi:hypothetical protein